MSENTDKLTEAGYFPEQAENIDGRLMGTKSNPPASEGHYRVIAMKPNRAMRTIIFGGLMAANHKALELMSQGYTVSVEHGKAWTPEASKKRWIQRNPASRPRQRDRFHLVASRMGSPLVNKTLPSKRKLEQSAAAYRQMGYHVRTYVIPAGTGHRCCH